MNKEELLAAAKEEIFGPVPSCKMAQIGRNMAVSYFDSLIEDAEAVMLDMRMPHIGFETVLQNAFTFSSDERFPEETQAAAQKCTDNFRTRYEPLLEELNLKAA
jgi:hypothetical protein